jgi:hypothetical protein
MYDASFEVKYDLTGSGGGRLNRWCGVAARGSCLRRAGKRTVAALPAASGQPFRNKIPSTR